MENIENTNREFIHTAHTHTHQPKLALLFLAEELTLFFSGVPHHKLMRDLHYQPEIKLCPLQWKCEF